MIGAETMESGGTNGKMAMFRGGRGTILFFEDQEIVRGQQEAFKAYADNFPVCKCIAELSYLSADLFPSMWTDFIFVAYFYRGRPDQRQ